MIRLNIFDYRDAQIHVKRTIKVLNTSAQGAASGNRNGKVIFKNCVPFINSLSEIRNTQLDDADDINVAIPI